MKRWTRAVALVALVAGLMVAGSTTGVRAETEGDTFAANIAIDIVVRGTPPPGTQFVVDHPNNAVDQTTVDAATTDGTPPDIFVASGTIYRDVFVSDDGGADAVSFACTMDPAGAPLTPSTCAGTDVGDIHHGAGHADIFFNGGAAAQANVTITFTFGRCGGRAATVLLADGDTPTSGNDVILGTAGANTVNGLGGDDRICGGGGADTLRGGSGTDRLFGGNGPDRLEGGLLGDRLFGQNGNDTLLGQDGTDRLDGGANRDTCDGGPGVDTGPRCEVKTSIP